MAKILKETKDYALHVGVSPFDTGDNNQYLLINKNTEVVEIETRVYPEAFQLLDQLQNAHDKASTVATIAEQSAKVRPLIVN
jgi:hypothetical protein